MKVFFRSLLLSAIFAAAAPALAQTFPQREIPMTPQEVYVPTNLKTNAEGYLIVSGYYNNSCAHWGHARIENKTPLFHEVTLFAEVSQAMCLMVITPYTRQIELGQLQPGEHVLRLITADGQYYDRTFYVE